MSVGDAEKLDDSFDGWSNVESLFTHQDEMQFFNAVDEIDSAIANYIRTNRSAFSSLLPLVRLQLPYLERFAPEFMDEYWRLVDRAIEEHKAESGDN